MISMYRSHDYDNNEKLMQIFGFHNISGIMCLSRDENQ